jgi:AcrR family transcriptional regulator
MRERGPPQVDGGPVGMSVTAELALSERRPRLIAAFSKAAAEEGYAHLDLDTVARYAGLTVADFEAEFDGVEAALLAAQEAFHGRLRSEALAACEGCEDWSGQVRAALAAVLASLIEAGPMARVFAVEVPASSFAAAEFQLTALEECADLLRQGRSLDPRAALLPELTERLLVGGAAAIVCSHLLAEDTTALPALAPELATAFLAPYLGVAEALRVAAG